ncbi:hypothetical protein [Rectinema subterraneum]
MLLIAALFAPVVTRGILQAQEKELVVYSTIFAEYADKMKVLVQPLVENKKIRQEGGTPPV